MKFLKQKSISRYSVNDDSFIVYDVRGSGHTVNGSRAVMDITGGLRLPKGTTAQRPQTTNVDTANGPNGFIRYNTTTNVVEGYINGAWEVIRASGTTAIQVDRFAADGTETTFGPLNSSFVDSYSRSDHNIIVLIENVWQIGDNINFTVVENPSTGPGAPYTNGWYVKFTSSVPAFSDIGDPIYVTVYYGYGN